MSPAPRETSRMRLPEDSTPPAVSSVDVIVGLARLEERLRAMSRRMDDTEERQDSRDELLRNQLTLAVQDAIEVAIKRHVDPLAEEVRSIRDIQLRSGTSLKTIAKLATLGAGALGFAWSVLSHFWTK